MVTDRLYQHTRSTTQGLIVKHKVKNQILETVECSMFLEPKLFNQLTMEIKQMYFHINCK